MRTAVVKLILLYQKTISPGRGISGGYRRVCVFYPSCSEYTIQAVRKYGLLKGILLCAKRISRCHPWQEKHNDPLM
ncbi:MAG: membrane protein insertion efficiency factor YidD [Candidatus Lloydbacteria bacterium CG22_combo_CG10-13_8_21_14_all_47_15]|uniref:Putative membrane protein insertion efficiency factor n=1 Tax=Candidatus Lloydbacteria bacterium CG22_combo_CG10-13_8_21_14_all_47_15 TaxID=1974635 RepID=A0A2H0CU55_9BACT|nr:MAG: membrane protein insertion efficiency factor YidD [Candidatus Lloydbacteria bacterium CG22_combo_CG10-13_8_21_14_all_47_15]